MLCREEQADGCYKTFLNYTYYPVENYGLERKLFGRILCPLSAILMLVTYIAIWDGMGGLVAQLWLFVTKKLKTKELFENILAVSYSQK